MSNYLSEIMAAHRAAARRDRRDPGDLLVEALAAPPPVPFAAALAKAAATRGLAVVAEMKRRSPSRGKLTPRLQPADVAAAYAIGGATCLSVLTDSQYFGGSPEDLVVAKASSDLPVLRKDFTVSANDVCDARLMGADAVLLIAAALSDEELASLSALAKRLKLDALVEVHDRTELSRALDVGARLIGVNQRDLETFAVDPERAVRLAGAIPERVVAVAESGVSGPEDAARLAYAGYQAVLVGETLMRAPGRAVAVRALVGHPIRPRPGPRPRP